MFVLYDKIQFLLLTFVLVIIIVNCCDNKTNKFNEQNVEKPIGIEEKQDDWDNKSRMRFLAKEKLPPKFEVLKSIHKLMGKPESGSWLSSKKENSRTIEEYIKSKPIRPSEKLNEIVIQLLGDFSKKEKEIIKKTALYIQLYYNVPVKIEKEIPLEVVPVSARRYHGKSYEQILSTWVLYKLLLPRRPENALAYIAFTTTDLWPREGWNFVFGQASLRKRVGVWSIARFGNPQISSQNYQICLLRTIKTAVHELGHILSIKHCIAYECVMNGSMSLEEADQKPLALCPLCLYKVCWNVKADLLKRYKKLASFCQKNKLYEQEKFFWKSISLIESEGTD